jgi:hypothetical protein
MAMLSAARVKIDSVGAQTIEIREAKVDYVRGNAVHIGQLYDRMER